MLINTALPSSSYKLADYHTDDIGIMASNTIISELPDVKMRLLILLNVLLVTLAEAILKLLSTLSSSSHIIY